MRALRVDGAAPSVREIPVPTPSADEALVAVGKAGICHTDLEVIRGYKGFTGTLGHEFVGRVVESPDPNWTGRRVCAEINVTCGSCPECLSGASSHCRNRTILGMLGRDGAFADYIAVPLRNLHLVPDEISDDAAVFVEPLAAAFEILEQVSIEPNHRIAVLGDGKLGQLCAQVIALTGGNVILLGRHRQKLQLAARRGISTCLSTDWSGEPLDMVVEATGSGQGLATALDLVRPRGVIVLKTTVAQPLTLDLAPIVVKEVRVIGSRCGPFPRAIAALKRAEVDVEPLIAEQYSLDDGAEALSGAARRGVGKVIIQVS